MKENISLSDFYQGKKVFITGHTGFKGTWMCRMLQTMGAEVTGYAMEPPTNPSLFEMTHTSEKMNSMIGDVRDLDALLTAMKKAQPEIVIHMAAQPLVRESYQNPVYTYDTNVMGTVHICEAVRQTPSVRSFVNVTTDKVYRNKEWQWGYRENEELCGYDPYSNSKSCSELVTDSYRNSFFADREISISTMRAGNVIGGGDFATDRIIPDCIRAALKGENIVVRNPYSTRPYQHVLEPVYAYLMLAALQYEDKKYEGAYNVGPEESDCLTTGVLVDLFCKKWDKDITWIDQYDGGPHEANFLKLDCSKLKSVTGWRPRWNVEQTMDKICEWSFVYRDGGDVAVCMDRQIEDFLNTDKQSPATKS